MKITIVDLPYFEPIDLGLFSLPITVIWIVGVVNAINLIDGLDGLAGGVILFAAVVNLIAAVSSNSVTSALLMAAMGGGILGFLTFNWHPAKIYLGDGGAYGAGLILATSALIAPLQKASTTVALLVPLLASGLPIFDTIATILRRYLNGKKLFAPDRGHLHHVLLDAGIGYKQVVIGLYLISAFFGSLAIALILNRNQFVGLSLIGLTGLGLVCWGLRFKVQLRKLFIKQPWDNKK